MVNIWGIFRSFFTRTAMRLQIGDRHGVVLDMRTGSFRPGDLRDGNSHQNKRHLNSVALPPNQDLTVLQ